MSSNLSENFTLGRPLPLDEHACSVSMPTWADVERYEKDDHLTHSAIKCGYPRFKIHETVAVLHEHLKERRLARVSKEVPPGHTVWTWAGGDKSIGPGHNPYTWSTHVDGVSASASSCSCFVFPTLAVAQRFATFMKIDDGHASHIEAVRFEDLHVVHFNTSGMEKARLYWQHSGEILSSRHAEAVLQLQGIKLPSVTKRHSGGMRRSKSDDFESILVTRNTANGGDGAGEGTCDGGFKPLSKKPSFKGESMDIVRRRIANLVKQPEDTVQLTVSGMAAIFTAIRVARKVVDSEGAMVVFGFPYLDTLKICRRREWCPGGCYFFGYGGKEDMEELEKLMACKNVCAILTEFPSNPLLKVPDLQRLTAAARKHGAMLIVDDTISTFGNVDLLHNPKGHADMVVSSLTKLFSGCGDVMAGSIVLSTQSPHLDAMRAAVPALTSPQLYPVDAQVLEVNSRDFLERCKKVNVNAMHIAQWLYQRPEVRRVHYPGLYQSGVDKAEIGLKDSCSRSEDAERNKILYDEFLLDDGLNDICGYGCLLSVEFVENFDHALFFDLLDLAKGPSLGTNFTLICPYTLLAHYGELPWAKGYGVHVGIVRMSIGLEDVEAIKGCLINAMDEVRAQGRAGASADAHVDADGTTGSKGGGGDAESDTLSKTSATMGVETTVVEDRRRGNGACNSGGDDVVIKKGDKLLVVTQKPADEGSQVSLATAEATGSAEKKAGCSIQ